MTVHFYSIYININSCVDVYNIYSCVYLRKYDALYAFLQNTNRMYLTEITLVNKLTIW